MELLTISQLFKYYKHLHRANPTFGMDIFSKDFQPEEIVTIGTDSNTGDAPPVKFGFYALVLSISGQIIRNVNQYQYKVQSPSLQLVPPGCIHSFKNIQGAEEQSHYVILFEKNFLKNTSSLEFHNNHLENVYLDLETFQRLKGLYEEIDFELKDKQENFIECVQYTLYTILIILKRKKLALKESILETKSDFICNQFLHLIEKNFLRKKHVSDYAKLMGITPKHLSETVKEKLDTNALSFIHKRLLKESQYLLFYTNKSIYEIAIILNFQDASQFSKFFKLKVGLSPKRYRLEHKKYLLKDA